MLGLMMTSSPGLTNRSMPPSAAMARRVSSAGSAPAPARRPDRRRPRFQTSKRRLGLAWWSPWRCCFGTCRSWGPGGTAVAVGGRRTRRDRLRGRYRGVRCGARAAPRQAPGSARCGYRQQPSDEVAAVQFVGHDRPPGWQPRPFSVAILAERAGFRYARRHLGENRKLGSYPAGGIIGSGLLPWIKHQTTARNSKSSRPCAEPGVV